MAIRVSDAGSGTLVAWKVPWPDVFLTEERLLSQEHYDPKSLRGEKWPCHRVPCSHEGRA